VCVRVAACLGVWVCTTKTPDQNDLKLAIVVLVFDTGSQPTDFEFKRARVGVTVYG